MTAGWLGSSSSEFGRQLLRQIVELRSEPRFQPFAGPDQFLAKCCQLGALALAASTTGTPKKADQSFTRLHAWR